MGMIERFKGKKKAPVCLELSLMAGQNQTPVGSECETHGQAVARPHGDFDNLAYHGK